MHGRDGFAGGGSQISGRTETPGEVSVLSKRQEEQPVTTHTIIVLKPVLKCFGTVLKLVSVLVLSKFQISWQLGAGTETPTPR